MEFIATYWLVWLLALVASAGYALYNQATRVGKVVNAGLDVLQEGVDTFERKHLDVRSAHARTGKLFASAREGAEKLFVAMLIAGVSGVLLVISIVVNILQYLK